MAVFVRRARFRNYKSIAACDVSLGPLAVLVGPNGAGKSNFLDALCFVADALKENLEHAFRERGGINNVRRRSHGHPTHFGIRLDVTLPDGRDAWYAFRVGAEANGGFAVQHEECLVAPAAALGKPARLVVQEGSVKDSSPPVQAAAERDRLALGAVSALPEFRPLYEGLCSMGFYDLSPPAIRALQDPDPGHVLARDGRNVASVMREMSRGGRAHLLERIAAQFRRVVPGVVDVEPRTLGPKETLEFRVSVPGDENPWRFFSESMSDGTLRSLGVLVAVLQATGDGARRINLVGIEEPEAALHPGAAVALADVLFGAAERVQVLVTTHSPDLLDHKRVLDEQIRAVRSEAGRTIIGEVDAASRSGLRENLYAAGELRARQLGQAAIAAPLEPEQLRLFEFAPDA